MPPSNPTGAVTIDAELAARLVGALEMIGTAFTLDEVNEAGALALIARLAERGGDGRAAGPTDPARARAARDYDVLRGLLGRAGAPQPLRMSRPRGKDVVIVVEGPRVQASYAVAESPGDATSGPVTERVPVGGSTPAKLTFTTISAAMPISRVELFDRNDVLVAFGPSLAPNT
jgi:hypothetical protein